MKSKIVSIAPVAVLLFGVCCLTPQWSYADQASEDQNCLVIDDNQDLTCSLNDGNVDYKASSDCAATIARDFTDEQNQLTQDALTQATKKAQCDATAWGFIGNPNIQNDVGSCGHTKINQDAGANASFVIQTASCNGNNTDPEKLAACLCPLQPALDYTLAKDAIDYNKCTSDAVAMQNDSCIPLTVAVKAQSDALAEAAQAYADSTAQAVCTQTTTVEDNDTTPICSYNADTTYFNCVNTVDCNHNPPNCCVDNAQSAYNSALATIFTALASSVGTADGQYQHDTIMCDADAANGPNSDAVANATYNYSIAQDNITYNMAIATAANVCNQTKSTDAAKCTMDQANCVCNIPAGPKRAGCITTAAVTQNQNDKVADTLYNSVAAGQQAVPPGSAYSNFTTQTQADNTTLQNKLQSDRTTDTACKKKANDTFNEIYNDETTLYNANSAAAAQAYQAQVQACNPSGGPQG